MSESYQVPIINQINRRIMRVMFRAVFNLLGDVQLKGLENIPEDNRYVIAINHISLLEVPFMAAFWPVILEMIGAADLWKRPGQSIIVRLYRGIQVNREQFDRKVFQTAEQVLAAGKPLLIAPEGGRSHTTAMNRGKPGVAYIIDKTEVPVLPVGILGSTEDFISRGLKWEKPPLHMIVGEPFQLPKLTGRGEERRNMRQTNADLIMAHIAALLPPEYHGFYSNFQEILDRAEANPEK
jgi:1-acyl-sn-glycerol-3-phosphate acyltransferase